MLDDGEEWITAIRKGYETDPYCQDILAYLQPSPTSSRQRSPAEARQHTNDCRRQQARGRHYELSSNGLLTHRASGTLVISNVWSIKERILREAHDSAAGGHFGTLRTHAAVARRFFWPRQFQEIKHGAVRLRASDDGGDRGIERGVCA
jgi:hypothetical protein